MPQNLKTSPQRCDDDLPILSPEEERLVEAIASGKGHAEAYRIAYDADGYNANSLAVKASRKIASAKIQRHLRAVQSVGLAKIGLSREDRIRDRLAFAARAENAGNFGAAHAAHDAVDTLLGIKVERYEDVTQRIDSVAMLKEIAQASPELAASLAAQHGIEWSTPADATKH